MSAEQKELPMTTELVERPMTPLSLIEAAVNSGTDATQLEKLLELQERWEANEARKAFAAAMTRCKAALPTVTKESYNKHTQSHYAALETVSLAADPIITANGFTLSFGTEPSDKPNSTTIICVCRHELGHAETYRLIDCPHDTAGFKGTANKTPIQGLVSTMSYGKRVLKLSIFNMTVTGEDRDGNAPIETITQDQVNELEALLMETNSDIKRFADIYGADRLADIPAVSFQAARGQALKKINRQRDGNRT
jgi:hypothetical protein